VLGATLAIVLSFNIGYTNTLLIAVVLYVIAGVLLTRKSV
jgi:hypothetical protein